MLKKIQKIIENIEKYSKNESIPISKFAIFLRTPIKINNDSLLHDGKDIDYEDNNFKNTLTLIVRTDKKINSFDQVLNEFFIAYSIKRKTYLEDNPDEDSDDLPDKLLTEVLHNEMFNVTDPIIKRHDGLIGQLVGLYYWDCAEAEKLLRKSISSKTIADSLDEKFNISRDDSTIRKDYKATKDNIEKLVYSCDFVK